MRESTFAERLYKKLCEVRFNAHLLLRRRGSLLRLGVGLGGIEGSSRQRFERGFCREKVVDQRLRGGLVIKAHRRLNHSTLDLRVITKKKKKAANESAKRQHRGSESSLLTTYWSESTLSSRCFGGPALRHGSLNSLFQVATKTSLDVNKVYSTKVDGPLRWTGGE